MSILDRIIEKLQYKISKSEQDLNRKKWLDEVYSIENMEKMFKETEKLIQEELEKLRPIPESAISIKEKMQYYQEDGLK